MKKRILLIAAIFTAGATFAQDLTSKKGTPILPEAGDYAIGFDADNLVNYAGNLFNGAAGNSANNLDLMNTNTIYGKMFKDANTAYRGMLRLGFGSTTNNISNWTDPNTGNTPTGLVEESVSSMNITLGGGIEMRRGKGRLQGVYGPMLMISLGSGSTEYSFEDNQSNTLALTTEDKQGGTFGLSLGAFGGVEYFFAPKISLGAEVAWGINFNSTGEAEVTVTDGAGGSTTTTGGDSSSFGLDVTPNSVISLNFHF